MEAKSVAPRDEASANIGGAHVMLAHIIRWCFPNKVCKDCESISQIEDDKKGDTTPDFVYR